MRCKIFLITSDRETKRAFEEILSKSIENGAELFIVEKKEEADALILEEKPQLVFYDEGLDFSNLTIEAIPIAAKNEKNGHRQLYKPIKSSQLLAFCHKVMGLSTSPTFHPM